MVLNFQNVQNNNPTVGSGSAGYVDASKWGLASLDQLNSFKIYINGKQQFLFSHVNFPRSKGRRVRTWKHWPQKFKYTCEEYNAV